MTTPPEIEYYLKIGAMVRYGSSQALAEIKTLNLSHENPSKRITIILHDVLWGINAQSIDTLDCSIKDLRPNNMESFPPDHRKYCSCLHHEIEKAVVAESLGDIVVYPSLQINDKVLVKPNFNREAIILKIDLIGDSFLYTVSGSKVPELFYYFDLIKLP